MKKFIRSSEDFEEYEEFEEVEGGCHSRKKRKVTSAESYSHDDLKSEVYNALADIMFRMNPSQEDMYDAIDWFNSHFYIDEPWKEDEDDEDDGFEEIDEFEEIEEY